MTEEAERRRVVRGCLRLTRGTAWAADGYQLRLLVQFIQGKLTIDQVCSLAPKRADLSLLALKTKNKREKKPPVIAPNSLFA